MNKKFNIYSRGILILKDDTLSRLKRSLSKRGIQNRLEDMRVNEFFVYSDPESGRQWEYERIR